MTGSLKEKRNSFQKLMVPVFPNWETFSNISGNKKRSMVIIKYE